MIRMAIVVCVAILVITVSVQAAGLLDGSLFGYAHAEKYTAGDADIGESVCALDIHWENGKVNLEYHSGEKIELRESSSRPISEDMKMRWWLDGDTLRVQYAKSGLHFGWNQEKELTVRIPEGSSSRLHLFNECVELLQIFLSVVTGVKKQLNIVVSTAENRFAQEGRNNDLIVVVGGGVVDVNGFAGEDLTDHLHNLSSQGTELIDFRGNIGMEHGRNARRAEEHAQYIIHPLHPQAVRWEKCAQRH